MQKTIKQLLILMLTLSLIACGQTTDSRESETSIPHDISRIVPSGPLAQIVLFAIAPEMIAGLASHWDDSAQGIIPEEYYNLPYLGQLYSSADLNIEELAAIAPELIIDIGEPKNSNTVDLDNLQKQTNIPTVFIPATLETMPETYRNLGKLLGKEEKAEELAQFCERVYDRTLSIMEKVGENKMDVLLIGGEEGLNVIGKGSYHAELLDLLANNVAVVDNPSSKGLGNSVDMEQIALWNPDFIIFMPESIYETVSVKDTWSELAAISTGNYVEVPAGPHNWMGMPPSVQRYLGMIWLTAVLYPEYCNYDMKSEILEYYKLFYSCDLTDAQYEALTENAFLK